MTRAEQAVQAVGEPGMTTLAMIMLGLVAMVHRAGHGDQGVSSMTFFA